MSVAKAAPYFKTMKLCHVKICKTPRHHWESLGDEIKKPQRFRQGFSMVGKNQILFTLAKKTE